MKRYLFILALILALVLNAGAEKFFWGGTYYEWAMVIAVDQEKKTATVIPDPADAPAKTLEVPLRYVTKEMLAFYAKPELDINSPLTYRVQTRLDKDKGLNKGARVICGKVVGRLPDGTLLLDCFKFQRDSSNSPGNVRLTLLAPTKLVEGNVVFTAAIWDNKDPSQWDPSKNGFYQKPPVPYKEVGLPPAH
jgi:hypothetical protein